MLSEKMLIESVGENIKIGLAKLLRETLVPNYVLGNSQIRSNDIQMKDILKDCLSEADPKYSNIVGFDMDGVIRKADDGSELKPDDLGVQPYKIYLNYWIYTNSKETHERINQIFDQNPTIMVDDIDIAITRGKSEGMTYDKIVSKITQEMFPDKFPEFLPAYTLRCMVGPFTVKPDENTKMIEPPIVAVSNENLKDNGPSSAFMVQLGKNTKVNEQKISTDDTVAIVGNGLVRLLQEHLCPNYVSTPEAIGGCSPKERNGCVVGVHLYDIHEMGGPELEGGRGIGYAEGGGYQQSFLDLHYMISVCPDDKLKNKFEAENRILGKIAQVLKSSPTIPQQYLEVSMDVPIDMKKKTEFEDKAKVWAMYGESFKPSLFYVVTGVPLAINNPVVLSQYEQKRIQKLMNAAQPNYESYDEKYYY